jgi:F0F1-type ATP synthase membrane subunit b/b'
MAVLVQMGINGSIFIQIAIFIITISILAKFVFTPYSLAVHERKSRTKGGEELATEIVKHAANVKSEYESEAKALHQEIKNIFMQNRSEALRESEKIVNAAKLDAQLQLKKSRSQIEQSYLEAQESAKLHTQELAMLIAHKILGKK